MSPISVRASSLPRALACPGSVLDGGLRIDQAGEAAGAGTAAHEALRPLVAGMEPAWDDIPELASAHRADPDEVRILVGMGARLWGEVADRYIGGATEVQMEAEIAPGLTLTGRPDIIREGAEVVAIADWKTGRLDSDYRDQLLAYAALALLRSEADRAVASILWVRDGEIETYRLDRPGLEEWTAHVAGVLLGWDGQAYRTGPHCRYCPRAHDCAAAGALIRRDLAALQGTDEPLDLTLLAPADIIALHARARQVADLAGRVKDAIRAHVIEHGDVDAGDAGRLTIQEASIRKIDTMAAWDVLQAYLDDDDLAKALDVRVSRAEKIIAKNAGRGRGAAAVREFSAALAAAGAVTRQPTHRLVARRS